MAEQPAQAPAAAPVKKEKIVPPSPPLKIRDRDRGYEYMRVGFLGEVSHCDIHVEIHEGSNEDAIDASFITGRVCQSLRSARSKSFQTSCQGGEQSQHQNKEK